MGKAMRRASGTSAERIESNQLQVITQGVGEIEKFLKDNVIQIARSAPSFVQPDAMIRLARTMMIDTPDLLKCDPVTILGAVIQSTALGLELDKHTGAAYLVPFTNNKRGGILEAQLIIGYRGLMRLARRSDEVTNIEGRQVRTTDRFEVHYGTDPKIIHIPAEKEYKGDEDNEDQYRAFYVCADLKGSQRPQFDFLWKWQVDRIRNSAPGRNSPAWRGHYGEMGAKTVLRRLSKWLPVSIEMQKAVSIDEMAALGQGQQLSSIVDRSILKTGSMALPEPEVIETAEQVEGKKINGIGERFYSDMMEMRDVLLEQGLDNADVVAAIERKKAQAMAQHANDSNAIGMIESVAEKILQEMGEG